MRPHRRALGALAALAFLCLAAGSALGAAYYVDFDSGSDAANGRSPQAAFKHCPGDSAAQSVAAATTFLPGDTVIFKGGVHYRGTIQVKWSGTAGNPITYDGNTAAAFGTGRAVIEGSEPLTGWTRCQSAAECGGNPNWANIYYAYAPAGTPAGISNLYENDQICWLAQEPDQPDPFFMDNISNFYTVPPADMTTTSIVDPARLNQSDPGHWDGAYVMVWVQPNVVRYRKILSFIPAQNKITYDATGNPYTDRDGRYSLYNSLHLIDTPGEYFLNETPEPDGRRKVYLWPRAPGDINTKEITVSVRTIGFDLVNGRDDVTIRGFRIQKISGSELHNGIGIKALSWSARNNRLVIRDNHIRFIRHHPDRGYGGVYLYDSHDCVVENNLIEENPVNMGILIAGGSNQTVRGNVLRKCGAQTIWFMGVQGGQCLNNEVYDGRGTHANGISVYQGASNVLVFGNKVFDSNISITTQASSNVTVAYNVCYNPGFYVMADWSGCVNLKVYNNTFIRDEDLPGLTIGSGTTADVKNNVSPTYASSGSLTPDANRNIWFKHSQMGSLFADPANHDYRPKAGSPAVDAGLNLGFTADIAGTPVPQGSAPDIGAYEFPRFLVEAWSVAATHGGAEIVTPVGDNYVEPRGEGLRTLRVAFSSPLDPATVTAAAVTVTGDVSGDLSGRVGSATLVGDRTLQIGFAPPLPDGERFTVAVTDALRDLSGTPAAGDRDLRLAALAGDVDGSGQVNAADMLAVRSRLGQAVTADTARCDLDGSGTLTAADMLEVRRRSGKGLP